MWNTLEHSGNNEFFMADREHCDDGRSGYNLNLLQGELMTPCPGKLCHCYVLVDCQGSTHKLISFPHFPSPDDVQCPHLETIRLRILWTSNYPKVIVFLKTVNKQQEASVMSAIVDMIKVIRVSEIYQK